MGDDTKKYIVQWEAPQNVNLNTYVFMIYYS